MSNKCSKEMDKPEKTYCECSCHSLNHLIVFHYDPEYNELYLELQLIHYRNIFQRIWVAVKYIFGYKSDYGHWDCFTLSSDNESKEEAKKIINVLNKYINESPKT